MSRNLVCFVLLLCPALRMKLVGGQSDTDVWFSLNGTTYQNNSVITLEDIGEGDDALLCITDQHNCCRNADTGVVFGNWFFPNGARVPSETVNDTRWNIYRTRGQSVVRLHRRRGGAEGIYRCEIPDTSNIIQSIYIGVYNESNGDPNVTELTFDRESRTLTCTSTGGPATTVTWTKDGAVITPNTTHQQTQMIVNTTEGIYQNTLTIAQSVTGDNLYGLYSCTVENSRGSSNRTVYFYGDVWFSLKGITYQNNSIVTLEDIGEGGDALLCMTDVTDCCRPLPGKALGNWFLPNGTRVPSSDNQGDFYRSRGQSVVRLQRRRGGADGIYRCVIPVPQSDAEDVNQTIFIGVYTENTGAPNITELTFNRESRTLTCTSSGGPATTVTWTKDGAMITPSTTHQQTQTIVDTVGGIYQNTLTIADDQSVTGDNLYGSYSCTVENSRGSSNRTVYFFVCISSVGDLECAVSACPSLQVTSSSSPQVTSSSSPQVTSSSSLQVTSSSSPQVTSSSSPQVTSSSSPHVTSSPSSPGTDSTTTPPTCSCSTEAIVITGAVAGVSGIVITLTMVVIVAVIRRRRASDKLKDLNMRSGDPVFANMTAIGMTDCPAYGKTTQHQQDGLNIRSGNQSSAFANVTAFGMTDSPVYRETTQQHDQQEYYEYVSLCQSQSHQDSHSLTNSQTDAYEN